MVLSDGLLCHLDMRDHVLTAKQAAEFLGLSKDTLYTRAWRQRHGLPAFKVGAALRFRQSDLIRFLRRCRETPERRAHFEPEEAAL